MDPARVVELSLLDRQKPMNEVIDRGDSAVQQFYNDAVVFVTGGSGFLGKQFIEKLFRSCNIKKLYVLLRPKKGNSVQQRLASILEEPVYDNLRKKKPNFGDRIAAVEGDVADIRLGLSDSDWTKMTQEVTVIIHMAATVRFDEPIKKAGLINVRGTREVIELGKSCANLKVLIHVSTAFAHATVSRIDTDVHEQFYPCSIQPDVFLDMVETTDEEKLDEQTPALINDWPNTYTFTKALAEELIKNIAGNLPLCIVKPPVVLPALTEPSPGWVDNTAFSSPSGFLLGSGIGVLHTFLMDQETSICIGPVDYVNNAIIASGWDSVENRQLQKDIPIYTFSSSKNGFSMGAFVRLIRMDEFTRLITPKALWYAYAVETNNIFFYWLLTWILHYIPAYFLDAVVSLLGVRPKGLPSLIKIYTKFYKLTLVYNYFWRNWNFTDDNLVAMIKRMSLADRAIYNCDVSTLDQKEITKSMCIGLRRFIVKDGLEGSEYAYRKQKWLFYANILFYALYAYLFWYIVSSVYFIFARIVPSLI